MHSYGSLAKLYHCTPWQYQNILPPRYHAYGCVRGRSREQAIAVQLIVQERCQRESVSAALHLFDGRNIFPSISHESIDKVIKEV